MYKRQATSLAGRDIEIVHGLVGGDAIDEVGSPLPDETLSLARESDAILLGVWVVQNGITYPRKNGQSEDFWGLGNLWGYTPIFDQLWSLLLWWTRPP